MKINGFGKRFLSLLLAMVALVGLLSVGAMAEGTAPSVTLKVQNVQRDGNTVTADVVVAETVSAEYGIAAGEFTVVVPDGLTLTSIQSNVYRSSNPDGIEGLNAASNVATCYFGFFINILEYDAWLGGGKLATLTFTVKDGAYGDQVIGIKNPALGTSGSSGSSGVEVDENSRLPMNTPTSGTLSLPSVTLTFDANGHGTAPEAKEMAVNTVPEEPSPAPTATGYTFGGWYTDEGCTDGAKFDFTEPLKEDATVYAKWTANQYTVTFDSADGTLPTGTDNKKTVTFDDKYGVLPTPSRDGYNFDGWYLGETKITADSIVATAEDHTLTAGWVEKGLISFKEDAQTYTYDNAAKSFALTEVTDDLSGFTVKYRVAGSTDEYTMDSVTDAGTYDVKVTRPADTDYKAVNKELPGKLVVNKAEVVEPEEPNLTYTWTGLEQEYTYVTPSESDLFSVNEEQSTLKGTAAGTKLKVTYVLNDAENYQWKTRKDSDPLTYSTTIQKMPVTDPEKDTTEFVYDGTLKTYTVAADDNYTVTNNTRTDAGTQKVTIELADPANMVWKTKGDSTAIEYDFNIAKKPLTVPTAANTVLTYNKSNQTLSVTYGTDEESFITATDNSAKVVGTYAAKYTIRSEYQQNYCWAGMAENVTEVTIPFSITAMKITPPTAGTKTYTYSGSEQTYEFADKGDETEYDVTGNEQTNAGNYTVTVALKDKDNTTWSDGTTVDQTYSFVIQKANQEAPTGLTTEAETIYKKGDGKLMGLDKALMEYRLKGSTAEFVQPARGEITLPAGTYEVRYAEDQNHNASPVTEVTVVEGRRLSVTFDTGAGSDVDSQNDLGYRDPVAKPDPAPTYPGFTLVGWYKDEEYKDDWDFATDRVEADTVLYAKWELSIGIEGDARFTEGKAPAEGVKIIVGKGLDQTQADTQTLELKKVTVAGKKLDDENYTVAYGEDGLTITLKQDYLNTLGVDEYEIGVVVDSEHLGEGRNLAVTLTVDPEPTEAGKPAGKPGKAVKTGDSSDLLLWSILSLGAGAGLVCIGKKRREN